LNFFEKSNQNEKKIKTLSDEITALQNTVCQQNSNLTHFKKSLDSKTTENATLKKELELKDPNVVVATATTVDSCKKMKVLLQTTIEKLDNKMVGVI
jgi:regulator of replication initiation timing